MGSLLPEICREGASILLMSCGEEARSSESSPAWRKPSGLSRKGCTICGLALCCSCSIMPPAMSHSIRSALLTAGFDPQMVKDFDDLKKLPILTKRDIQEHREELDLDLLRPGTISWRIALEVPPARRWFSIITKIALTRGKRQPFGIIGGLATKSAARRRFFGDISSDISLYRSFKARLRNLLIDRQLICDSGSFSEETLGQFARTFAVFAQRSLWPTPIRWEWW